jgi:hypothetical protein
MKEIEKLLEEIEGLKKRVEELRAKEQDAPSEFWLVLDLDRRKAVFEDQEDAKAFFHRMPDFEPVLYRKVKQEKKEPEEWRVSEDNNIFCGNMRVGRCLSVFDAALIVREHNRAMQEVTR